MSPAAPPTSTNEALEMLTSAMSYLSSADPTQMVIEEQARCLATIEKVDAVETAARASVLGGFIAGKGYCDDAVSSQRPATPAPRSASPCPRDLLILRYEPRRLLPDQRITP